MTKAKAVKPIAEQMITLGRRGDLHARRQAIAFLRSKDVVHKLFAEVAPRFADRPGGYTRIVKIGPRDGDAADMVYLELVDSPLVFKSRLPRETLDGSPTAGAPRRPTPTTTRPRRTPTSRPRPRRADGRRRGRGGAPRSEAVAEPCDAEAADDADDASPSLK